MKMNNRYAKSLLVKHLIAACSILIVGAVCTVVFKEWAFIAGAALIGLYFAAEALSVFFNDKNGRYYMVNAIVVSCEEGKDLLNNAQLTYRMIPVDEDGEYINAQGLYDIFIHMNRQKGGRRWRFNIGGTYLLMFCGVEGTPLNEQSLVFVKQRVPVSVPANHAEK